jgi:Spy/CpxP family protein refolding chaperone
MKSRTGLALLAAVSLLASAAAAVAKEPPFQMNPRGGQLSDERTGFDVHDRVHIRTKLKALREEAIAAQAADGGTLTEAHKAELNGKLAVIRREACQAGVGPC